MPIDRTTIETDELSWGNGRNTDKWYQRTWRPAMAFLYFGLCLLDYGIRPAVNYFEYQKFELTAVVQDITELESPVQVQIIETLREQQAIPPILSEFVHIAFGTVLGAAAYTRGREKIERERSQRYNHGTSNTNSPTNTPTNQDPGYNETDIPQG